MDPLADFVQEPAPEFAFYSLSQAEITPSYLFNDCYKAYAAYDIGSGATKYLGAIVNHCIPAIEEVFSHGALLVPYRQDLLNSPTGEFSDLIMEMGLNALKIAKQTIEYDFFQFNGHNFTDLAAIGVATAAFRMAANADSFIEKINEELDIAVNIISQEEEAKLAYYGAIDKISTQEALSSPIVWDIGGGSMQLVTQDEAHNFHILGSNFASANFAALLAEEFFASEPEGIILAKDNISAAIDLAKMHLIFNNLNSGNYFKNKLSNEGFILGVGTVHNSLAQAVIKLEELYPHEQGLNSFSKPDLYRAIERLADKSENEIANLLEEKSSDFSKIQLSNMVLVYASMELLGIDRLTSVPVNNTSGLILQNIGP